VSVEVTTSYLIYATSRSGSTLLCDVLGRTGLAGEPDEYFCDAQSTLAPPAWQKRRSEIAFSEYVGEIVRDTATANGVFGAKFGAFQHQQFVRAVRAEAAFIGRTDREVLDASFPNLHYIYLTRRDKIRQAISAWRAMESNQWNTVATWVPTSGRRPRFHYTLINELMQQNIMSEAQTSEYFEAESISPLTMVYEDLARDSVKEVRKLLAFLGIDVPEDMEIPPPRVGRQGDELNEEWRERFLRWKLNENRLSRALGVPRLLTESDVGRRYIPARLRGKKRSESS